MAIVRRIWKRRCDFFFLSSAGRRPPGGDPVRTQTVQYRVARSRARNNIATISPRCRHDVATMSPRCRRSVAKWQYLATRGDIRQHAATRGDTRRYSAVECELEKKKKRYICGYVRFSRPIQDLAVC